MGNDGSDYSLGYMQIGGIPSFKIYDASEDIYYDAVPSENYSWANFDFNMIDYIDAVEYVELLIPLHYENNLISFYTLPNDTSVPSVISDISENLTGIVGESFSSQNNNGVWEGSLINFDTYSGYWLRMTSESDVLLITGPPPNPNKIYELDSGLNLISFPTNGSVSVPDGIDDSIENEIPFVIGESKAAAQLNGQWVGSLTEFEGGKGYWINSNIALDFQYNLQNLSLSRRNNINVIDNQFPFNQSQSQSFYFMTLDKLSAVDINIGDWIVAYNDNLIVGARQWNGNIIDVPVMGYDGSKNTIGYCNSNDTPRFRVYSSTNDKLLDITSDYIPSFTPNSIVYLEEVKSKITDEFTPSDYNIILIYPNPFNPETTIEFSIPDNSEVSIVVYNLYGEKVTSLVNDNYQPGYYNIIWDASQYSSGIYFVNMSAGNFTTTQKLILVK